MFYLLILETQLLTPLFSSDCDLSVAFLSHFPLVLRHLQGYLRHATLKQVDVSTSCKFALRVQVKKYDKLGLALVSITSN